MPFHVHSASGSCAPLFSVFVSFFSKILSISTSLVFLSFSVDLFFQSFSLPSKAIYARRYLSNPRCISFPLLRDSRGIYMFHAKKSFVPRSYGGLIHMLSSNFVSLMTIMVSHKYSLTKNPSPPAPLQWKFRPFRFPLFMRNLQLYILFSPPLSPMTPGFILCLGCVYLPAELSLFFALPQANPQTFQDPILNFRSDSSYSLSLSKVLSPSYSLFFPLPDFSFCSQFSLCPLARGRHVPPLPLRGTYLFLLPLPSFHPWTTYWVCYSISYAYCPAYPSNPCRSLLCPYPFPFLARTLL